MPKENGSLISTPACPKAATASSARPFFFSLLNGTLDVTGEVGGVELGAAVMAAVELLGVGRPFSTSADMVPGEPGWSGWGGVKQAAAPFGVSKVK